MSFSRRYGDDRAQALQIRGTQLGLWLVLPIVLGYGLFAGCAHKTEITRIMALPQKPFVGYHWDKNVHLQLCLISPPQFQEAWQERLRNHTNHKRSAPPFVVTWLRINNRTTKQIRLDRSEQKLTGHTFIYPVQKDSSATKRTWHSFSLTLSDIRSRILPSFGHGVARLWHEFLQTREGFSAKGCPWRPWLEQKIDDSFFDWLRKKKSKKKPIRSWSNTDIVSIPPGSKRAFFVLWPMPPNNSQKLVIKLKLTRKGSNSNQSPSESSVWHTSIPLRMDFQKGNGN